MSISQDSELFLQVTTVESRSKGKRQSGQKKEIQICGTGARNSSSSENSSACSIVCYASTLGRLMLYGGRLRIVSRVVRGRGRDV